MRLLIDDEALLVEVAWNPNVDKVCFSSIALNLVDCVTEMRLGCVGSSVQDEVLSAAAGYFVFSYWHTLRFFVISRKVLAIHWDLVPNGAKMTRIEFFLLKGLLSSFFGGGITN